MTMIGVILAGGSGERMGGTDKGALKLGDSRLIDRVYAELKAFADPILISGAHDYGLGLTVIEDLADGPVGPAAGLWSAMRWIEKNAPETTGFLTMPVDAPFFSTASLEKLASENACTIAISDNRRHPTFAYWRIEVLTEALRDTKAGEGIALNKLAERCQAKTVELPAASLININTPEELANAEALLKFDKNDAEI